MFETANTRQGKLAVVGAHLSGMPLNGQLTARGATLREATTTAPRYRLHALAQARPPKPVLQRVEDDAGAAIALEVWDMPLDAVLGRFVSTHIHETTRQF